MHRADGLLDDLRLLLRGKFGNAKICDLRGRVAQDHDIMRLNILMDNAAAVGVLQRARDLLGEKQRLLPGQPALFSVDIPSA